MSDGRALSGTAAARPQNAQVDALLFEADAFTQVVHLDERGAQLEMYERDDGVIELRAALPTPAEQRWFWADRWRDREREVDEHIAAGIATVHESTQDFLDRE